LAYSRVGNPPAASAADLCAARDRVGDVPVERHRCGLVVQRPHRGLWVDRVAERDLRRVAATTRSVNSARTAACTRNRSPAVQRADHAVTGDLNQVIPALVAALRARQCPAS
jgi:hypothetical protein